MYKPKTDDGDAWGDADQQMSQLTGTERFRADRGFKVHRERGRTGGVRGTGKDRVRPVDISLGAPGRLPFCSFRAAVCLSFRVLYSTLPGRCTCLPLPMTPAVLAVRPPTCARTRRPLLRRSRPNAAMCAPFPIVPDASNDRARRAGRQGREARRSSSRPTRRRRTLSASTPSSRMPRAPKRSDLLFFVVIFAALQTVHSRCSKKVADNVGGEKHSCTWFGVTADLCVRPAYFGATR